MTSRTIESNQEVPAELERLNKLAEFLDNRFRIPGTQIRFGMDALLGLLPYIGDVLTFLISGYLITVMSRKGASGMLVLKMLFNIFVDGAIGTIPFLGDLFDIRHKANTKNVNLLLEHYEEDKHQGSAWWVVIMIFLLLVALIGLSVYVVWRVMYWIIS